jgi:hypothetical protein
MADTIKCPSCSTEQPPGPRCASCGLDFRKYAEDRNKAARKVRCPYCRTEQPLGASCIKCGLDFREYSRYIKRRKAGEDVSPPRPPARVAPPAAEAPMELEEAFRRSWSLFTKRWATLIGLTLIAGLVVIASTVTLSVAVPLIAGEAGEALMVAIVSGIMLFFLLAIFFYMSAIYAAASINELTLAGAFREGLKRLPSFIWVMLLHGLIVVGGFFLFIVPGFVFMVWFLFAPYLVFTEGARGMDALLRSREYVRGHGWDVFFKLVVIWLVYMVVGSVPLVGPLLAFPFMLLFIKEMLSDMAGLKGVVNTPEGLWPRLKWPMLGLAGHIVPVALILTIALPIALSLKGKLEEPPSAQAPDQQAHADTPILSIERESFVPGEEVPVRFSVPEGFSSYAWAGMVPSVLPHGSEEDNRSATKVFRFLGGNTEGSLSFKAPETPGAYDIRLHDREGGEEIAFVSFVVGDNASPDTVRLRAADNKPIEVSVRITSRGCRGAVLVNGAPLHEMHGTLDGEELFSGRTVLIGGKNVFRAGCEPAGEGSRSFIRIKVYGPAHAAGGEADIANWYVFSPGGEKTFRIIIEGAGLRASGLPSGLLI